MGIEIALFNKLSTWAGVGDRIYPLVAPQNTNTPYLVYRKAAAGKQYTHDGSADFSSDRIDVTVYSTGHLVSLNIAKTIVGELEDWTDVQALFNVDKGEAYDPGTRLFSVPLSFIMWHSR